MAERRASIFCEPLLGARAHPETDGLLLSARAHPETDGLHFPYDLKHHSISSHLN